MKRIVPWTQEGSGDDEQHRDARLELFDRLVSGEETDDSLCGFDGLSALPPPNQQFESVDDSIEKLNEVFRRTVLRKESSRP